MQQAGVAGPSGLGAMADIGGALLGGFKTFNSLKAPSITPWGGPGGGVTPSANIGALSIGQAATFTPGSIA